MPTPPTKAQLESQKEALKLAKEHLRVQKQHLATLNKSDPAYASQLLVVQAMENAVKNENDTLTDIVDKRKKLSALQLEAVDAARNYHFELKKIGNSEDKNILKQEAKLAIFQSQRALLKDQFEQGELTAAQLAEQTAELDKQEKKEQKKIANMKKIKEELNKGVLAGTKLGRVMSDVKAAFDLGGPGIKGGLIGSFKVFELGITRLTSAFMGMGLKLAKKGFGLIFSTIKRLIFEVDSVSKAFERATGMSDRFGDAMYEQYRELDELGFTMEDVSKGFESMIKNSSEFTLLNYDMAIGITKTANVLTKMGVAIDDLTTGLQNSIKFFGMSGRQYEVYIRELEATARALRMTPQELTEDFAKAGKSLAKFGSDGSQMFKELARVSKITGMEIEKIIDLTAKFDTFESAAEMTGKLNAALGGNFVNAMDMMMDTDPVSRFEKIRDAIMSTGLTFDEMSYYQKQFYTQSLGLSDVGELALMMSGNMDLMSGATNTSAREYEELAEQARINMDLQQRFNALIADAAPHLREVIDKIHAFIGELEQNKQHLSDNIQRMFDFALTIERILPSIEKMPQMIKGVALALGGLRLAITAINMAMAGTPAGLLLMGVGGVAGGLILGGLGNISQAYNVERNSPTQAETMQMIKEDSENAGIALDNMRESMHQNVEASRRAGRANNDMTTQLSRQASALREVAELSQAGPGTDLLSSLGNPDVEGLTTTLQLVEGIATAVNSVEANKTIAFNTTLDSVVAAATAARFAPPVNKNTGVGNQQLRGDSSNILGVIKVQGGPDFAANVSAIAIRAQADGSVTANTTGGSPFVPGVYNNSSTG